MKNYPYIPAKYRIVTSGRKIDLVILHATASPEGPKGAEANQKYFANPSRPGSTHLLADSDSVVRSVLDKDIAYGASGANRTGLHIELCGYANQSASEWTDAVSLATMEMAAEPVSDWCHMYSINPILFLRGSDLRAGKRYGITSHAEVEKAFPSTGHTDPGSYFPTAYFLDRVLSFFIPRPGQESDMADKRVFFTTPPNEDGNKGKGCVMPDGKMYLFSSGDGLKIYQKLGDWEDVGEISLGGFEDIKRNDALARGNI